MGDPSAALSLDAGTPCARVATARRGALDVARTALKRFTAGRVGESRPDILAALDGVAAAEAPVDVSEVDSLRFWTPLARAFEAMDRETERTSPPASGRLRIGPVCPACSEELPAFSVPYGRWRLCSEACLAAFWGDV